MPLQGSGTADRLSQIRQSWTLAYFDQSDASLHRGGTTLTNALIPKVRHVLFPLQFRLGFMSKKVWFFLFLILVLTGGGAAFVMTWDMPPPTTQVEKVISNDRFPR